MTITQLFDRDELFRLSREGMENSLRFFLTINENLLKMGEWQMQNLTEHNKRAIETINKAYDEHQKNSRIIMSRIETVVREMIDKVAPAPKAAGAEN